MAGTYELWLTTDKGVRIQSLDNAKWFSASRVVNGIGRLSMGLPATFNTQLLKPDRMVQVWRAPTGGRLGLWRPYFIRKWRFQTTRTGLELINVYGSDPVDLLRRRIVTHFAGSSNASKTGIEADDMMKDFVADAITDGNNPAPAGTRVWPDFSVQGDLTDGPQLDKAAAWQPLLTPGGGGLIADLAKAAKEAGTEVFFDVVIKTVNATSITFEFRTYTGQPGMDVSDRVVFDQERGNLKEPFLEYDYSEELNYVYAGGPGEEAERVVTHVQDVARYNVSQWNRCEGFIDARNQTTINATREVGRAFMTEHRPMRRFGGIPIDTAGTRFGRDWDVGYKVTARYRGQEFDSIVRSVVLNMNEQSEETIQARLEYED